MGACWSRERNATLTTTWAEVTAPGEGTSKAQITEQRRTRPLKLEATTMSSRSENALERSKHKKHFKQRRKTKSSAQTDEEDLSQAVSILPTTTITSAVSNSPKSIIIPEITEHSSSSDDELMMDEMILEESQGGRAMMQRIDPNRNIDPETSVASHTRAVVGTSTTLRPQHRRRKSKSRSFPIAESSNILLGPAEDIAYQPNDPNSTAILRRFLSPVSKTKPPPPPPKATCFTQVHASLTQSPIQEDDDSPPSASAKLTSVPFTTPSKRFASKRSSSSSAPSDEETDPTIPIARISRRRNSNGATMEIGRLSPIKLKTSTCVSPQSIRVYYDISPPQESAVQKSDDATKKEAEIPRKRPDVTNTEESDEAVPALAVTNFSKLQLQVAVAAKHSLKQRVITKIDDRMQDVQQHRQLWDEYHAIQKELQKPAAEEEAPPTTEDKVESAVDPISPVLDENPVKKEVSVTSVRRRRRRRFLQNRKARDDAMSETDDMKPPVVVDAVEYDMEDDSAVLSKQKSPKRPSTLRSAASDQESTKTSETNPKTPRRRRQRAKHPSIITSESSTNSQPSKEHNRVSSFDLHETQTWFFDFQEEFVHSTDPVLKGSTTIVTPTGELISTVGKVKSQSDLSLLSASSLEVQRQLYAEKRRLRKMKHTGRNDVDIAPNDDTPPIRNGFRPGRQNDDSSIGSARSYTSNTSYDYGPTRRRLPTERRHASGIPAAGSAQQILEASTEEEKLRIARDILKMRSMTHMEVAFTFKSVDAEETGSFVSDLDETSSFTSLANSSYASNNDYGVMRRVRRSYQYQAEDEDTDDPSVVSEVSMDLSQTMSVERKNRQLGNAKVPVYDFQSIVQRRLDIEERLRALMVEEPPSETAAPPAARGAPVSATSIHVTTALSKPSSSEQKLNSTPVAILSSNVISPDIKPVVCGVVESASVAGSDANPVQPPSTNLPKGTSDFSRLLDAVLVNRQSAGDEGPTSNSPKRLLEDADKEPTVSSTDESKNYLDPVIVEPDAVPPTAIENPLSIIEESSESNESTSHVSAVNDNTNHACTVMDDHTPRVVSPDKDEFSSANSMDGDASCSSDADQVDETHETLLLADQVALSVNDILERYRSVV